MLTIHFILVHILNATHLVVNVSLWIFRPPNSCFDSIQCALNNNKKKKTNFNEYNNILCLFSHKMNWKIINLESCALVRKYYVLFVLCVTVHLFSKTSSPPNTIYSFDWNIWIFFGKKCKMFISFDRTVNENFSEYLTEAWEERRWSKKCHDLCSLISKVELFGNTESIIIQ